MQTPQKTALPSGRKSSKQHPKDLTQRTVQSDNDAYAAAPQPGSQTPSRNKRSKHRKNSNAQKKGAQSDVGEMSDKARPASHAGHTGNHHNTKATPIKDVAYAGSKFHASPAPNLLPVPAFFSKSVPNTSSINTIVEAHADDSPEPLLRPPSDPKSQKMDMNTLFELARQRDSLHSASPARFLSPPTGSPASQSPGPRADDGAFPFELDAPDSATNGSSITPFKDRISAAMSPQHERGASSISEDERRAKTAALKQALMHTPPPSAPPPNTRQEFQPAALGPAFNDSNPFNARNISAPALPSPQYNQSPNRYPQAPYPQAPYPTGPYQNGYANNYSPHRQQVYSPNRGPPQSTNRPPSSNLRNVYEPSGQPSSPYQKPGDGRISTAASPQPPARQLNFSSIYGGSMNSQRPDSRSNDQGLDDLKKILNLSLADRA